MSSLNRRLFVSLVVATAMVPAAKASEFATRDDAVKMVKKAIAYAKSNGTEKLYAEVTGRNPVFIDRDLYIFTANEKGVVLSHGANPKLVGRDLTQLKDADGKAFVAEIFKQADSMKPGWVEYRWPNPVTKQIDDKVTYVEKVDGVTYCAGVYK